MLFSFAFCSFLLIIGTPINKIPSEVNQNINEYLRTGDLISLSKVDKINKENIKKVIFGKENDLIDIFYGNINTNKTKDIKRVLLTLQGTKFINNLNNTENQKLWKFAIHLRDIKLLRGLNTTGLNMSLSTDELVKIIKQFKSVEYYKIINFLLQYIVLNDHISKELISNILFLITPKSLKYLKNLFIVKALKTG